MHTYGVFTFAVTYENCANDYFLNSIYSAARARIIDLESTIASHAAETAAVSSTAEKLTITRTQLNQAGERLTEQKRQADAAAKRDGTHTHTHTLSSGANVPMDASI